MRLSPKEQKAITAAFAKCLSPIRYQLYLFGSRADDAKKGGDIDLLVVVSSEAKSAVVELKTKIRGEIFTKLPEQKIDITVANEEELSTDVFLASVFPKAIFLGR